MFEMNRIFLVMILVTVLVISPVLSETPGASVSFSMNADGLGSLWYNAQEAWNADSGSQYNDGFSSDRFITGTGTFSYSHKDALNASINNRYTQKDELSVSNGILFENFLSLDDSSMNGTKQHVDVAYSGYLPEVEIKTAKFVNNADLSMGQQAAWNKAGMYTGQVRHKVAGTGSVNYINEANRRFAIVTNESGGAIARPEFDYYDFSDQYYETPVLVVPAAGIPVNVSTNATEESV
jgi:hypothetical protein